MRGGDSRTHSHHLFFVLDFGIMTMLILFHLSQLLHPRYWISSSESEYRERANCCLRTCSPYSRISALLSFSISSSSSAKMASSSSSSSSRWRGWRLGSTIRAARAATFGLLASLSICRAVQWLHLLHCGKREWLRIKIFGSFGPKTDPNPRSSPALTVSPP
jgi:hypothetical protein